ncbi:hypothetical protein ABZ747_22085 [Kitasatospora cineracea]|uniref:hypothetical protein n=1 Tax=Kitasatospora cineracea TaxID=88074 RepID=UPI00340ED7EE
MARSESLGARCARAFGLVGGIAVLWLHGSNIGGPPKRTMRRLAASPEVRARRDAAEREMRAAIERLGAVDGLEHVLTRFTESFTRYTRIVNFGSPSVHGVTCDLRAVAWFGVRGEVADVLDELRRQGLADWLPTPEGRRGTPPPPPEFGAPGLRIDWDRPGTPLPPPEPERAPRRGIGTARLSHRRWSVPRRPPRPADARARYGTLLVLSLGGPGRPGAGHFSVDHRKG